MIKLSSTFNYTSAHRTEEPNFPQKFQKFNKNLFDHFTISSIFNRSESKTFVHCKSLKELLEEMIETRNVSPNHIVKLGIDGGGSFVKVVLGVLVKKPIYSGLPTKHLSTTKFS